MVIAPVPGPVRAVSASDRTLWRLFVLRKLGVLQGLPTDAVALIPAEIGEPSTYLASGVGGHDADSCHSGVHHVQHEVHKLLIKHRHLQSLDSFF